MIDWSTIKFNKELSLTVVDDNVKCDLKVKLIEYEYSLHRHPLIADVMVIESNNIEIYPINSIMRLPMETNNFDNFLLFAPLHMSPSREFKRKGFITLN